MLTSAKQQTIFFLKGKRSDFKNLPSLRMQRGGGEDQSPRVVQVRMLRPARRYPASQLYCSTVPTWNKLVLVSVRLAEPCCTMEGLIQPDKKDHLFK